MANEATLVYETELPIPFTVANATGVEKGSVMKLTDPMTCIINSGAEDAIAGIAAEEKIANDGKTTLGVYRRGIFKVTTAAAVTAGNALSISATVNKVQHATKTSVGCKTLGIALETAGGADETILMELNPGCNNTAYS